MWRSVCCSSCLRKKDSKAVITVEFLEQTTVELDDGVLVLVVEESGVELNEFEISTGKGAGAGVEFWSDGGLDVPDIAEGGSETLLFCDKKDADDCVMGSWAIQDVPVLFSAEFPGCGP